MNILLTNGNSSIFSGGSVQMLSLSNFLINQGHNTKILFIYSNFRQSKSIDNFKRFKVDKIPWNEDGTVKLKKVINKGKFDIIHAFSESHPFIFNVLNKSNKHENIIINIGHSNKVTNRDMIFYQDNRVKKIICVSNYISKLILKSIPDIQDKIVVCYGSVDLNIFKPVTPNKKIIRQINSDQKPIIGMIASLRRYKGIQYFILAASEIIRKGYNYIFLIIGAIDGWLHKEIKDLIRNLEIKYNINVSSSILFLGEKDNIHQYLSSFNVCVSSSTSYEGINGSIREAMAMKIPVVCTNVGGNYELVINNKTGFLIEPKDYISLAERIIYIVENRENLNEMKDEAYNLVKRKFNEDNRFQKINDIYLEVINDK
jgi:glycosyltransferase involved in cell wall biosynthesis